MKTGVQAIYKKLNWKFLVSYIIVFSVPFLVLSSILTWLVISKAQTKIETTNHEGLAQVCLNLEKHFEKLNNISLDMTINPNVAKLATADPIEEINFERELKRYTFFSDIAEDIYVAYDNNQKLYSNVGTMDVTTFVSQRFKDLQIDQRDFEENISSPEPKLVMFKEKSTMLFYFVPFIMNGRQIGKIIYAISIPSLMHHVVKPVQKAEQSYSLYLDNREVSTTLSNGGANRSEAANFFTQSRELVDVSLTIQSLMPQSVLNREIIKVVLLVVGCLLVLLLIGLGVVVYYGHRQYEPVYRLHKLYRYVAKDKGSNQNELRFDELGDFLFQQSMMVDSTKKEIQHIRDEAFWKQVLKGDFNNLQAIKREAKRIGRSFTFEEKYFLGIMSADLFEEAKTDVQMKTLLMNLFPYLNQNYQVECIEMTYLNQFIFIFQMDEQVCGRTDLIALKSDFQLFLTRELGKKLRIVFGQSASTIDMLHHSYISVMAQKESSQQFATGNDDKKAVFSYPEQAVIMLKQAIKVGNAQTIEQLVKEIVLKEQQLAIPFYLRQSYYHFVLQELLAMSDKSDAIDSVHTQESAISLSQIEDKLKQLALDFSNRFAKKVAAHEKEVEKEILQMIHKNFTRSSFSLEEMAVHFGVSLSKMSMMVKTEANVSFSKYVQSLRIERVKQELLETSKPVKEIIMDVGYHDIANFTRKFREEVGVPPGQFRKIFDSKEKQKEAHT